jgi:FecR protein
MHRLLIALTILTVFIAAPTLAQQVPPARVGRVSLVSGNLAFHTAGQAEWSAGGVNYPVAAGASLWTDTDARAEIRIAPDTIDMASSTELDVAELDERVTRLDVPQGRIHLHLRRLDQGQSFEIDIPRGAVQLQQPGYYDIDAGSPDQPARVAVFEGSARFVGNGADIAVKAGDVAVLNGDNPVTATLEAAVADTFVQWCRSRDYDEKRLAAPYHVSPNMTGYVELDEHGRWDTAAGYGEVWYPNVPAGWAPYTNGRWVSVAPWGWTWIDAEPWGFAPGHYGRWAHIGESWGWVPGAFEPSPIYAPAVVAFLGGPGAGLYVSGAVARQVGWFPLAPGETYWPSYTADPSYIRSINRGSVGSIDNVQIMRNVMLPAQDAGAQFANRRFATVAPQHVFASAGKIEPVAQHVPAAALEHASVTMRPPQVRPAPARAVPGPAAFGARGQPGPVVGTQGEHMGGAGRLLAPSNAAALPPHPGPAFGGRQPGQPTNTAALPPPGHPGEAPAHSGTTTPPPSLSFPGQHDHPTWSGATHPHAPAQAPHPPPEPSHPLAQAFYAPPPAPHPPAPAFHPPPQAPHPPAQAFHAPAPAPHPLAQAVHPPPQSAQQVAHAPQPAKGGGAPPQAPKGGGPTPAHDGKGEKHD